jgi:membrane protein YqaA with SNARE-associated domain
MNSPLHNSIKSFWTSERPEASKETRRAIRDDKIATATLLLAALTPIAALITVLATR